MSEKQTTRPLVEVTVSAPADEVWRSLRDPARIRQWFGWDADTLPAEIDTIFIEHVRADDAERILRFEGVADWFEVEARGETSVVRIVRPAPSADTDWEDIFEDMIQGWIAFVQQLKFALDRHPNEDRRTLYLSGSPRKSGDPLATAAIGLTGGAGDAYAVTLAPGGPLSGKVWHRGRHQIGVTVEAWGDGLLIVMDRPPSERWPNGGSQITLTSYGLGDGAFEALQTAWSGWWQKHFGPPAQLETCD